MRDYALIWNKRIERYEVFDLRDCKRQLNVLGECAHVALDLVTGIDELSKTVKRPTPYAETESDIGRKIVEDLRKGFKAVFDQWRSM